MLGALKLGADVLERMPDTFLLHEQQEKRQEAGQQTAIHAIKTNRRGDNWQIGRMA